MTKTAPGNRSYTHGHVAFFYSSLAERMEVLAHYLNEGLALHELCVFSTPGSTEQAIEELSKAGLDAAHAVDNGSLRIYEMYGMYLPDGKFAADFMLKNVSDFIEDARAQGYSGLRTAGEMRWVNLYPDLLPDASRYEDDVTGLCAEHHDFVGLCLYPLIDDAPDVIKAAMQTHPAFLYDGRVRMNPYTAKDRLILEDADGIDPLKDLLSCT